MIGSAWFRILCTGPNAWGLNAMCWLPHHGFTRESHSQEIALAMNSHAVFIYLGFPRPQQTFLTRDFDFPMLRAHGGHRKAVEDSRNIDPTMPFRLEGNPLCMASVGVRVPISGWPTTHSLGLGYRQRHSNDLLCSCTVLALDAASKRTGHNMRLASDRSLSKGVPSSSRAGRKPHGYTLSEPVSLSCQAYSPRRASAQISAEPGRHC